MKNEKPVLLVKDLLLPIIGLTIAAVGLFASFEANTRQELFAKADREQKYLDFFLTNYSDTSYGKQMTSFLLLKYINVEVRKDLIYSLSINTKLYPEAFKILLNYKLPLNFGEANKYLIEIYYSKEYFSQAQSIKSQLDSAGFKGRITVDKKVPMFWKKYGLGKGNSIRYYPSQDKAAMDYLFRFVSFKNPTLNFYPLEVNDPTRPHSISIHLPTKSLFRKDLSVN